VNKINSGKKKVFEILVKYNEITNQEMIKILESVEKNLLTKDLGSYYKSIMGLLNHMLTADVAWLRSLGKYVKSLNFLTELIEKFPQEAIDPQNLFWNSLKEFKTARIEMDQILTRTVQTMSDSDYDATITISGRRGERDYIIWKIFLHLFNHHTHHRGGVAVLLDQLGIENSYSNLVWKV